MNSKDPRALIQAQFNPNYIPNSHRAQIPMPNTWDFILMKIVVVIVLLAIAIAGFAYRNVNPFYHQGQSSDSGYWYDEHGPHLKPFNDEELEEIDV